MLSQKFWINYRYFTSVVLCTQTLHQQWLQNRTCYETHRSATIMVIKIELKIVDQIVTSVSFWPKLVKCWNFEGDCVPNGSTGKVATWEGSYLFMKYDVFRQNAKRIKEWSVLTASNRQNNYVEKEHVNKPANNKNNIDQNSLSRAFTYFFTNIFFLGSM